MTRLSTLRRTASTLMVSASALAIASVPAQAADVLFSTNRVAEVTPGQRVVHGTGVLQLRLDSGATLSFVEGAEFTLNADGSIDLHRGSVTVAGAAGGETLVRMPEGVEGRVGGTGNAASFSVKPAGESDGHTLTGTSTISRGRTTRTFPEGQMWESSGRSGIRRVFARASQETPSAAPEAQVVVADLDDGPVAAAENGLPVSLGDGLAAAGASSDVVMLGRRLDAANGNPLLDTYPTGDLARLVALAADLEGLNGGTPFPAAQADVIRTYLRYLANGGSGAQFLSAYAGFLTQYLDLVRAGGLPSQFGAASLGDINAFLAYQGRLGRLGELSAQNRALAETYLAFIRGGGNADLFAGTYTDLVEAYFAFVRGGGDPLQFAGASQEVLDAYIAFLGASGLAQQLSPADQQILAAYLDTGGFAFASIYAEVLQGYFAYLAGGGLPSASTTLTPAQLQAYLDLLDRSGLFAQLLGDQAGFYAAYLAHLRQGGAPDAFGQLNANIFAGYAGQLNAYFAFLQGGGRPSQFTGDPALLAQYLAALDNADALDAFLGGNAGFFAQYLAFLQGGGNIDQWSGLNANVFAGYASALDAYYTYLAQGGLPSLYSALTQGQIAAYVAALQAQGATGAFLAGLADFYTGYLAYLNGGGNPDVYTGLPVLNLPAFASALNAYAAFLAAGGLPSAYDAAGLDLLAIYFDAIGRSGDLAALLGANADLLNAYFAYFGNGGAADNFAGLPLYSGYVTALQAYFAFLDAGGLPAGYTALTPAQVQSYLAALSAAGGFGAQLGNLADFYTAYFAYLSTGGAPNGFSGLPVYAGYVSALNAYYAFLAGGGLPGDYTALTQQQISDYLAALNGAGGFAAYGALNGFFTQYFAFISGGGNPANFPGLPLYADYVSALNAYFAFLAGGGLPGDYTALTPQQISDYLAALNGASGFAAYGALNTFFAQYYAFLQGGGDPDDFAGLPVYADYLAALQAFYAYLAGGGLPSGYTALTPAQVEAYLAALAALGLLDANFDGSALDFWTNYLAFLSNGGMPDDFTGFPVGGGSGGGTLLTGYTGGFNALLPKIFFRTTLTLGGGSTTAGSESGFEATAYSLDANGGLQSYTRTGGTTRTRGTTTQTDVFGNADALIGRWTEGTNTGGNPFTLNANQGFHYLLTRPVAEGFALPSSGVIHYDLLAATRPTIVDGSVAPGTFTGDMAIVLGAQNRIAMEATVTVPGLSLQYATAGGVANPQQSETSLTVNPNLTLQFFIPGIGGNANCASDTCYLWGNGAFAGDEDTLGFTYGAYHAGGSGKTVIGAAIFGNGTLSGGNSGGGGGNSGGGSNPTALPDGVAPQGVAGNYLAFAGAGGNGEGTASTMTVTDGLLLSALASPSRVTYTSNANTLVEKDGDAGQIGWQRLENVTAQFSGGTGQVFTNSAFAGQSWHTVWGAPLVNRPASGLVTYELLGSTQATQTNAQGGYGTFDGAFSVDFATLKAGIEATVVFNSTTWGFASTGGVAAPSLSLQDDGFGARRFGDNLATTINGSNHSRTTFVDGFLAGDGASHAGFTYAIGVSSSNKIQGAAAFRMEGYTPPVSGGGGGGGSGAYTSDFTGTRSPVVFYTYTNGSLALGFGGEATFANGGLTGVSASVVGSASSGTTQIVEAGDAGALAWARWTNGSVTNANIFGTAPTVVGANGGYHVMAGSPSTSLPASGKIDYNLIATTSPTDTLGSAPGTLTGDLAIQFGSTSKVGFELQMDVGGKGYGVATSGGSANPSASAVNLVLGSAGPTFSAAFNSITSSVTGSGGACVASCQVSVSGALYGANGQFAGVAMNVGDFGGGVSATGLAIFEAAGAPPSGSAPGSGLTTMSAGTSAAAPAGWDRWAVAPGSISTGNGMDQGLALMAPDLAPGMDRLAASGIQFSADQLARLEAHYLTRGGAN